MLVLTRKQDQSIVIGEDIVISVVAIEEGKVKLGISAPKHVTIHRHEVYKSIQEENKQAVVSKKISIKDLDSIMKSNKLSK